MPVSDYDENPANNTTIPSSEGGDLFLGEGMAASLVNNVMRQVLADLAALPLDEQTVISDFSKTLLDNNDLATWQTDLQITQYTELLALDNVWTGTNEFTQPVTFSINIWDTDDGFSYDKVTNTAVWNINTVGAMSLKETGLRLVHGEYFDTFSDDETLANDSAKSAVSERALKAYIDQAVAAAVPVGTITMTGGGDANAGYLLCDGAAVSRTTYAALYNRIGDAFGAGNGSTTFNLPDLQDRVPRGTGALAGSVGTTQTDQVGPHGHTATQASHTHTGGWHNHGVSDPGHSHTFQHGSSVDAYGPRTSGANGGTVSTGTTSHVYSGISIGHANIGALTDATPAITVASVTTDETRVKSQTVRFQIKY